MCWRGSNEGFHRWIPGSNEKVFPTSSLRSLLRSPTKPGHKKMASCNKTLKAVFSSLNGIGVFFIISPKRNSQLKKFYSAQIPRV